MIDIDALSRPISEDNPSGPDLEYADVAELERFSAGSPGVLDPATRQIVGAEEPNWRKVAEKATQVLGKTKDLRAAAWLTRAELSNRGFPGLANGLTLIAALSDTYWETIYPPLDHDEGNDPIERLNVLANLSPDPASSTAEAMLRALRATVICESREVGRFTLRDLEYSLGRMTPPEGQKAPAAALLAGAWKSGDPVANQERREGIANGLAAIQAIIKLYGERSGQRPNLDLLQQTLKRVGDFYVEHDPVVVEEEPEEAEDDATARPRRPAAPKALAPPFEWVGDTRGCGENVAGGRSVSSQGGAQQPGTDVRGSRRQGSPDGLQHVDQGIDARIERTHPDARGHLPRSR